MEMEMEMEMDSLVGFRFLPTNEEIIHLLKMKRLDPDFSVDTVKEIDFYKFDPWDLPNHSDIQSLEPIWYFYCKPYYKYSKSTRAHRRAISGYWKITGRGSDMKAKNSKDVIGSKKILSFYRHDLVSKEAKTEWVMHEIHIKDNNPLYKEDYVVCRLERKRDNKHVIPTRDEGESSQHSVVAENTSPKSELPSNQQFVSNMNHVGLKTFPLNHNMKLQQQPSQCCDGYSALDNDSLQLLPNQCCDDYNALNNDSLQLLLNQYCDGYSALDYDSLQLLPNQCCDGYCALDYDSLQQLPNQCCEGYNPLDNDSFSELLSPIYPEHGSSYSNSPNNGCDFLNSQCDSEQVENLINSQSLTSEFNSSRSDEGEENRPALLNSTHQSHMEEFM